MRRILPLVFLLAACGKAPPTVNSFYDQQSRIVCDALIRCCGATQTIDACATLAAGSSRTTRDAVTTQIASGKLTYHADQAALCLDAQRGAYANCNASAASVAVNAPVCDAVFTGALADGDSCPSGAGCGAGLVCFDAAICAAPAARDADCTSAACASGLACLPSLTCSDPLPAGSPCTHDDQCASRLCDPNNTCATSPTVHDLLCG
jgi:hypothetical protein